MMLSQIDPLQPYFVLNTKLYRKLIPEKSPVAHFYQFTYNEKNSLIDGVVPDGAIDLIFDTDSGCATVSGSVESVRKSPFNQGHTYFGVRFKPGVFEHYGEISASELVEATVPLSCIIKKEVFDAIASCNSFEQRISAVNKTLLDLLENDKNSAPQLVNGLLSYIYEHSGNVTIGEMEDCFFYSRRHLLRVFKQYIGMDIKSFCRIMRFQSVLPELNVGSQLQLTEVAQNHGYYDQMHFQKEFKEFALFSPKVYMETLKENRYHNRIQCS